VNVSWFASLLLVSSVIALYWLPGEMPGISSGVAWSLGLAGGVLFFVSILVHELGHCIVARHYGIPVKNITLFVFGGVSQISHEAPSPRIEFLIAVIGPVVSLVLGGALLAIRIFVPMPQTAATALLTWLAIMNLALGIFNLLPGFPMDGGRLLRSSVWAVSHNYSVATRIASTLGRVMAYLFIGVGLLSLWPGGPLQGDFFGGLSLIIVGLFLNQVARQTQRQSRLLDQLRAFRADQVMDSDIPTVPADAPLRTFVYSQAPGRDDVAYFAVRDARVVGLVPRMRVDRALVLGNLDVTAASLMVPAEGIAPASPDDDGAKLLERMEAEGLPGLPVVEAGSIAGLVTRGSLFRLLRSKPGLRPLRL
jgi:Zn-dependent protease